MASVVVEATKATASVAVNANSAMTFAAEEATKATASAAVDAT